MSSDAARGAPNCDSPEVLRTSGRKTLRPPGLPPKPNYQVRGSPISAKGAARGQLCPSLFWHLSYGGLRTTFSYCHIESPARYRRGVARIGGKTRRAYPLRVEVVVCAVADGPAIAEPI